MRYFIALIRRWSAWALPLLLVVGCKSASGLPYADYQAAAPIGPAQGRIVVFWAHNPGFKTAPLVIVGDQSFNVHSRSFSYIDVPAGTHDLRWLLGEGREKQFEVEIEPGEVEYLEVQITSVSQSNGYRWTRRSSRDLVEVEPTYGRSRLTKLRWRPVEGQQASPLQP